MNSWRPDECPITLLPFFMWIEHPTDGIVPTYGGPHDSYTIPQTFAEDRKGRKRHEISYYRERYDHDAGGWVEGVEVVQEVVILEDDLNGLIDATEPPAVTVRKGWVCKDRHGLWWSNSHVPWWMAGSSKWSAMQEASCVTDPWPDKPNGGPECVMEVG